MALNIYSSTLTANGSQNILSAYFGDAVNIEITRRTETDLVHTLKYVINDEEPVTIVENYAYDTLTWNIPNELRQKVKGQDTFATGQLILYTHYNGSETDVSFPTGNSDSVGIYYLIDSDVNTGVFVQYNNVYDSNSTTAALTGNNQTFIKYYSNLSFNIDYLQTRSLASRIRFTNSGKTINRYPNDNEEDENTQFPIMASGISGTFQAVESGTLKQSIRTQNGLSLSLEWRGDLIEYSRLTCNQHSHVFSTDGTITFTIEGNYFNRSFGVRDNYLRVYYRYNNGGWIEATPHISESNYSATVVINDSSIDYRDLVYVECKAEDALMSVSAQPRNLSSIPTFDWNKNNFKFNVPVKHQSYITIKNDQSIFGINPNGDEIEVMNPCDNINNLTIGYGNYNKKSGATTIYGNDIHFFTHGDFSLNGDNLGGLIRSLTSYIDIGVNYVWFNQDADDAANWQILFSNCSGLTLQNSVLYCSFDVTLSFDVSQGGGIPTEGIFCGRVEFDNSAGLITDIREGGISSGTQGSYFTCRNAQLGNYTNPYGNSGKSAFDIYLIYTSNETHCDFKVDLAIPVKVDFNKF